MIDDRLISTIKMYVDIATVFFSSWVSCQHNIIFFLVENERKEKKAIISRQSI